MYDFHKVKHEGNATCFYHPLFRRGSRNLLSDIKRKVAASPRRESVQETEARDDSMRTDLKDCIGKLEERLYKLENHDNERKWLKSECSKLQYALYLSNIYHRRRNKQLEMMFMCLTSSMCGQGGRHGGSGRPPMQMYVEGAPGSQTCVFTKDYCAEMQKAWTVRPGMSPGRLAMRVNSSFHQVSPSRIDASPVNPLASPILPNASPVRPLPSSIRSNFSPVHPTMSPVRPSFSPLRPVIESPMRPNESPHIPISPIVSSAPISLTMPSPKEALLSPESSPLRAIELKSLQENSRQFSMPALARIDDVPSLEVASNHSQTPR